MGCSNTYDGGRKPITVEWRAPDVDEAKHVIRETFLQPTSYINASTLPGMKVRALPSLSPVRKENRSYDHCYLSIC